MCYSLRRGMRARASLDMARRIPGGLSPSFFVPCVARPRKIEIENQTRKAGMAHLRRLCISHIAGLRYTLILVSRLGAASRYPYDGAHLVFVLYLAKTEESQKS